MVTNVFPLKFQPPKYKAANFQAWLSGSIGLLLIGLKVGHTFEDIHNGGGGIYITDLMGRDYHVQFPPQTNEWPKAFPEATVINSMADGVSLLVRLLNEAGVTAWLEEDDDECFWVRDSNNHLNNFDFMVF
ncbi:hypothetical protein KBA63_01800 [Candidatus Woesebacteria bacterium]|nr:hypothetical protein [Candidatus Woesebacteria bacterium]MBP9687452.1 hypothetical protein [Candidatus Woesebacteria bacterium]